jgi:hypothetical protein
MACNPVAGLLQGSAAQPELMDALVHVTLHYPGLFQYLQVLISLPAPATKCFYAAEQTRAPAGGLTLFGTKRSCRR